MSKYRKIFLNSLYALLCLPILLLSVCVQMPDHCGDGTAPLGSGESCPPDGITYTLTVTAGSGGTVSPSGTSSRNAGIQVSIRATPNANCNFTGWSGDLSGTANPASVIMNGDRAVMASFSCGSGGGDTLTDNRDGQVYRTVRIGNLTWMAENLNFTTSDSWCYDNNPTNCAIYGRLYTWDAAMSACPAGWRLPTRADWDDLVSAAGGWLVAGRNLKSQTGWIDGGFGVLPNTDAHGFSALPGGYRWGVGYFDYVGWIGNWWSATEGGASLAWVRGMGSGNDVVDEGYDNKSNGVSVRCSRD
jgi:uncharacterized protein (TIGR02145 family)